jgi:plastocyanin
MNIKINLNSLHLVLAASATTLIFITAVLWSHTALAADNIATATDAVTASEIITEATTEEPVIFTPKVMVESCQPDEDKVYAGDEVEFTITLKNTSWTEGLRNMSVKITAPDDYFILLDETDNVYVGAFYAGDTMTLTFNYRINPITPIGQYNLVLDMDYADVKGNTYSQSGNAKVDIYQKLNVSFDELNIPRQAKVGEKIDASVNAINLGKTTVYNVRAVVECDGLKSSGTLFIGDIEPGNMGSGAAEITVSSLPSDELYGDTTGTVTYTYEDSEGNEYTETGDFDFTVNTPFTQPTEETSDETGQWWIIMGVIAGILAALLVGMVKKIWQKRNGV